MPRLSSNNHDWYTWLLCRYWLKMISIMFLFYGVESFRRRLLNSLYEFPKEEICLYINTSKLTWSISLNIFRFDRLQNEDETGFCLRSIQLMTPKFHSLGWASRRFYTIRTYFFVNIYQTISRALPWNDTHQ